MPISIALIFTKILNLLRKILKNRTVNFMDDRLKNIDLEEDSYQKAGDIQHVRNSHLMGYPIRSMCTHVAIILSLWIQDCLWCCRLTYVTLAIRF